MKELLIRATILLESWVSECEIQGGIKDFPDLQIKEMPTQDHEKWTVSNWVKP